MRARTSTIVSLLVTVTLALTLLLAAPAQATGSRPQFFFVPLSGRQEVPVRETPAFGFATFILSADQERFISPSSRSRSTTWSSPTSTPRRPPA